MNLFICDLLNKITVLSILHAACDHKNNGGKVVIRCACVEVYHSKSNTVSAFQAATEKVFCIASFVTELSVRLIFLKRSKVFESFTSSDKAYKM